MAATPTLDESASSRNSSDSQFNPDPTLSIPRSGVLTLSGYGIKVFVDRGHLTVEDGIGAERYRTRLPRVAHGLRRLVVIGADGMVSLAALRWLAEQDASFTMLDRDGSALVTTGPVRPSDARLRRAQALAHNSGAALRIVRELIGKKLLGQEQVARKNLHDTRTADVIAEFCRSVEIAETIQAIGKCEARAAAAYWAAWRDLPIMFPKIDLRRVPDHWRKFGTRKSPISGSPRLAVNPPNAILNYLYALLESEARLAASALGLDPGLGFLHLDSKSRDSLASDLMEVVRPQVDAFVLDWVTREPLKRDWFFEQRDGNCRLMGSFAAQLSQTSPMWGRAVAPFAECVVRALWTTIQKSNVHRLPATRLTQSHRRTATGGSPMPPSQPIPRRKNICRDCGDQIQDRSKHCTNCALSYSKERMVERARSGRVAAQSYQAQARRRATQHRHEMARAAFSPASNPAWLTEEMYEREIQPLLRRITNAAIVAALKVSKPYAVQIRHGRRRPHPRHWSKLASMVGIGMSQARSAS